MASKPRVKVPKSAKKGDVFQVKSLITHKMETGTRKNKKTGKLIPRLIINKFECAYNGKNVFTADLHASVAANPYFAFHVKADASGTLDFVWTDDKGAQVKDTKKITVS